MIAWITDICYPFLQIKDEWKYTALVMDRILLWLYVSVCTVGGASILLNAPMLYSTKEAITIPN